MPGFDEACLRHATHFLNTLNSLDNLLAQGGDNISRAIELFEKDWGKIEAAQARCEQRADVDEQAYRRHAAYHELVLREANQLYQQGGAIGRGLALFDEAWSNIQSG